MLLEAMLHSRLSGASHVWLHATPVRCSRRGLSAGIAIRYDHGSDGPSSVDGKSYSQQKRNGFRGDGSYRKNNDSFRQYQPHPYSSGKTKGEGWVEEDFRQRSKVTASEIDRNRQFLQQTVSQSTKRMQSSDFATEKNLHTFLDYFSTSSYIRERIRFYRVPNDIIDQALRQFCADIIADRIPFLSRDKVYAAIEGNQKMDPILLPPFFNYVMKRFPHKVGHLRDLYAAADFSSPEKDFFSRQIKRKVILHVGPTNSGKTYQALKAFKDAGSGIYLSPLRLLAHEIYARMNSEGVPCNMITGEERRVSMGVTKTTATVEMCPINNTIVDVGVIDEIQMLNDQQRGWAWTFAFLGLPAAEIHLCGEPAVVPLIEKLCKDTGDDLTVLNYERLSPVKMDTGSLGGDLSKLKKGDCLISFSRKAIYELKKVVEAKCGMKAAIIYGSLPPEARTEQARLFNDPNSGYDILIASDAVGMGINLQISRIVFERVTKFDGASVAPLSISQIKQIGGRAGRYGLTQSAGLVTALDQPTFNLVRAAFNSSVTEKHQAGLIPTVKQIEAFSRILPQAKLSRIITAINDMSTLGTNYFMCQLQHLCNVADALEGLPLSLEDKYAFIASPCPKDPFIVEALVGFARAKVYGGVVNLHEYVPGDSDLFLLERAHRIMVLYMWLSMRFPQDYTQAVIARVLKADIEAKINNALMNGTEDIRSRVRISS